MRRGVDGTVLQVPELGIAGVMPGVAQLRGRTPAYRLKKNVEFRSVSISTSTEGCPRSSVTVVV